MKKYILLALLCSIAVCQSKAYEPTEILPQDSLRVFKKKLNPNANKELSDLNGLYVDTNKFYDIQNFDININIDSITMLAQNASREAIKGLEMSKAALRQSFTMYNTTESNQKSAKTPVRIENKTFSNISEIEFFHKYGNIVVRESNSKQVELEIQYLDKNTSNSLCNVSVVGKLLSITTDSGSKNRGHSNINFIISIPKNTTLSVNLDYGNLKIDQMTGGLTASLSYSDMSLQKANNIILKSRYANVKIGEVVNADLSGSYSDIKINKANRIATSGSYNDYKLDQVQTLTIGKSTAYGDCKIGTVESVSGSIMYTDININSLLSDINISSQYGDVMLKNVSSKVKNIAVKGSYCDITIGLSPDFSGRFDATLNYGDLNISKKYSVKYTESTERSNRVVKKGQIGTGNPTTNIIVSNNYADIDIR